MKNLLFYISLSFFLSLCFPSFTQSVSVELSAKWVKGRCPFQKDSIIYYPELIVTYRNNSDTNYYFQKVSGGRYGLPMLPCGALIQYPIEDFVNPDFYKRAKTHATYIGENYIVIIGGEARLNKGWTCVKGTDIIEAEQEIEMINCDLSDIYEYLYREVSQKRIDSVNWFNPYCAISDLTPDAILDEYNYGFVFLRPGEIFQDSYNLVAFEVLKGSYTFCVEPLMFDYVLQFNQKKLPLPKMVGDYTLYNGHFNTNKLTIVFERNQGGDIYSP